MTQKDRLFYTVLIVILFSLFIIVGFGHFRMEQLVKDVFVSDRLDATLTDAVAQIDVERLKILRENPDDAYAQELRGKLETIRNDNRWAGMYLLTRIKVDVHKQPWIFLLDSRSPEDPLAKEERSFIHDVPELIVEKAYWGKVLLGQAYNTTNGARIGGFAPIGYGQGFEEGPEGEYLAVAVLVVEYDADTANSFVYQTLHVQCGVLIFGFLIICVGWLYWKSKTAKL